MNLPELRDVCWLDKKFRQGRFSLPLRQILNFPTSLICRFPSCATPQPPQTNPFKKKIKKSSFIDYCISDVLVYLMHRKSAEQNSQFLDSGKTIRHISLRWRYNAMTSFYRFTSISEPKLSWLAVDTYPKGRPELTTAVFVVELPQVLASRDQR